MLSPDEVVVRSEKPLIQRGYGALLDAIAALDAECFGMPWERRELRAFL